MPQVPQVKKNKRNASMKKFKLSKTIPIPVYVRSKLTSKNSKQLKSGTLNGATRTIITLLENNLDKIILFRHSITSGIILETLKKLKKFPVISFASKFNIELFIIGLIWAGRKVKFLLFFKKNELLIWKT